MVGKQDILQYLFMQYRTVNSSRCDLNKAVQSGMVLTVSSVVASVVLHCIELCGLFHCKCMSLAAFSTVLLLQGFPQQVSVFKIVISMMYFKWYLLLSSVSLVNLLVLQQYFFLLSSICSSSWFLIIHTFHYHATYLLPLDH